MTSVHDFSLSDSDRILLDQIMKDRIAEEPHIFDLSVEINRPVSLNIKNPVKKMKLANDSSSASACSSHKVSKPHQPYEIIDIDDDEDQNQNDNSKTIETHTIIDNDIQENETHVSQNKIFASRLNNEKNNSISSALFENISSSQTNCSQESINNGSIENIISEKQCEDAVHITEKPVAISKKLMPEVSNSNEEICVAENKGKESLQHEINAEQIRDGEKVQEAEKNEKLIEKN